MKLESASINTTGITNHLSYCYNEHNCRESLIISLKDVLKQRDQTRNIINHISYCYTEHKC